MNVTKQQEFEQRLISLQHRASKLTSSLPKNPPNINSANQLSRAVTSVGANYQEACCAESRKDFLHKTRICVKEANESHYWLLVIAKNNPALEDRMKDLIQENEEISRIFGKIVSTTKKSLTKD